MIRTFALQGRQPHLLYRDCPPLRPRPRRRLCVHRLAGRGRSGRRLLLDHQMALIHKGSPLLLLFRTHQQWTCSP
jgi:hypothetical protein